MTDMFTLNQHELPKNLAEILDRYSREWSFTYGECESMLAEVSSIGYTFEYGLDSTPYNLKPIKSNTHVRNHRKAEGQNNRPSNPKERGTDKP
jgi:hypothetical protein